MCYWWFAPGMFITGTLLLGAYFQPLSNHIINLVGPILGSIADRFSLFTPEGARISTDWTWLILYCTFCQAVVVLLGGWLRVQRGGWKLALV